MKKYFTLMLVAVFSLAAVSCETRQEEVIIQQDNDTYPQVLEITNVDFKKNTNGEYEIYREFTRPLVNTDVVLIFRQAGTESGVPVWQSIPRTLYIGADELDYDYDFTRNDIKIYAGGTYDLATTPQFIKNQTFRVVLVPASGKNANINYSDYSSVVKHFGIAEASVIKL